MKSDLEYRWVWFFSILSTLSGIAVAIWMKYSQSDVPIMLLGLTHAVVFIPAMIIVRANILKIIGLSLVCITFPIWGCSLISLLTAGIGSPIANSVIWGVVVALALKQPKAMLYFLAIGVISNAVFILLMIVGRSNSLSNEVGFMETIGLWYLLVLPVFPMLIQSVHNASNRVPSHTCFYCGYSLVGLLTDTPCPECGRGNGGVDGMFKDV